MKFIIMTNPAQGNNIVKELFLSGLVPELIVTVDPFFVSGKNKLINIIKKFILGLKYLKNKSLIETKYQAYFLAKKNSVPVFNSLDANSDMLEKFINDSEIDYIFTFYFKMLKKHIFSAPKFGCINFHPSILPHNRGANPWNWVIQQEKNHTGITFHYIDKGIDSGKIIKQYQVPFPPETNSLILRELLLNLGSTLFIKLIFQIKYDSIPEPVENQIEKGSYESPFNNSFTRITSNISLKEIGAIINSSRDGFRNAYYEYVGQKYNILNYTEIINEKLSIKNFPMKDETGNLIIKSSDDKIVLLITQKNKYKLK